ncbi:hypothetical protein [Pontiella sp.]|uniref:hypothetical protein n=1 Tax=Pontiella sp. TaxID=2837462 RepID=UPI0035658011
MNGLKAHWGSILSLLAVAAYFSPWYSGDPRNALGLYILAFFWFLLFGWITMIANVVIMIKQRKANDRFWKPYGLSALIIALSYLAVWIGALNGYMVTV